MYAVLGGVMQTDTKWITHHSVLFITEDSNLHNFNELCHAFQPFRATFIIEENPQNKEVPVITFIMAGALSVLKIYCLLCLPLTEHLLPVPKS